MELEKIIIKILYQFECIVNGENIDSNVFLSKLEENSINRYRCNPNFATFVNRLIDSFRYCAEKQLKEKDLYIETLKYNLEKNNNKKNCNCNEKSIFEIGRSQ